MTTAVTENGSDVLRPREYQLEMLRDSMQKNIIVAMDTGSGKTNIAVMRIAAELERCSPNKRVWFLCPKVALAQQQYRVISKQLPSLLTKLLLGRDGCEFWSTQSLWDEVLLNVRIVVCTHDILSNALSHAFVRMADIALLVFDEAHYCKANHAANKIMQHFYHPTRLKNEGVVPHVLGLTASPIFNDGALGLQIIERNLDAICRTPRLHREELLKYVHQPKLELKTYEYGDLSGSLAFHKLDIMFHGIDINEDPWVKYLRANPDHDSQKLEKAYVDRKTDCQEQLKALVGTTRTVDAELGSWAAEAYIRYCIDGFKRSKQDIMVYSSSLEEGEIAFMYNFLIGLETALGPKWPEVKLTSITPKVNLLIEILLKEASPEFSGIVFVDQRAVVCVLKRLLEAHPSTKSRFRIGASVGTSTNTQRKAKISDSVTRDPDNEELEDVLDDLRSGKKNLLISTTVVEEGIDITACNTVICFDQPKNLVSFIQRRGRARSSQSKYHVMLPEHVSGSATKKWIELEEKMKQMYMDHMRELQRLEHLETSDDGHREFEVPSTGAKLTLHDALPHLWHFCNTLPKTSYTSLDPIFICEGAAASESISCRIILPNCIDSSVREFESSRLWSSERLAKMDAAFEAYVGLYRAELINDNLLPQTRLDEEEEEIYRKIEKRENVVMVNQVMNPWRSVAEAWDKKNYLQVTFITISNGADVQLQMRMLLPRRLTHVESFKLYYDADTEFVASFSQLDGDEYNNEWVTMANDFTKTMLYSAFRTRMSLAQDGFPVLFAPNEGVVTDSIERMQGNRKAKEMHLEDRDVYDVGLIREPNGVPYFFQGLEPSPEMLPENGRLRSTTLVAFRCPKRTNYLHRMAEDAIKKATVPVPLDLEHCTVDELPVSFARFAFFIPSIMHKIRNALIVEDLCSSLLAPVEFSDKSLVLNAISAPVAQEDADYQRLEFLGDAILKYYTAISLTAEHLNYHEGYLAHLKDRVVSNRALAIAAKEKGLDRYILRRQFTGTKWRPLYNEDILAGEDCKEEELSTKILADVIESLVGAAYLDGGEPKLLACLCALLSKTHWTPLSHRNQTLITATSHLPSPLPQSITHLQSLILHTFTHPSLAIEALTHPSHISLTKTSLSTPSYQRLEFLGDAILDQIVTKRIFAHTPALPTHQMHLVRTAAVNADFLAYLALAHKVSIPVTNVVPLAIPASPLSSPRKRRKSPEGTVTHPPPETTQGEVDMNLLSLLRREPSVDFSAALSATTRRFEALKSSLSSALDAGDTYPWTDLAVLAPEKMISDMVESVLGAIYVDTKGDIEACEGFLKIMGVLPWLERALREEVRVWHPKEELGVLAAQTQKKVEYVVSADKTNKNRTAAAADEVEGGHLVCRLKLGGEEAAVARGTTRKIAETRAANIAVKKLKADDHAGPANEAEAGEDMDIVDQEAVKNDGLTNPNRGSPIDSDPDSSINADNQPSPIDPNNQPTPLDPSPSPSRASLISPLSSDSPIDSPINLPRYNPVDLAPGQDSPIQLFSDDILEDEPYPYRYGPYGDHRDYGIPSHNAGREGGGAAVGTGGGSSAGKSKEKAIVIDDSDEEDEGGVRVGGGRAGEVKMETSEYWSCAEEL